MGGRSLDDEIAQVPSKDGTDRYFVPNISVLPPSPLQHAYFNTAHERM